MDKVQKKIMFFNSGGVFLCRLLVCLYRKLWTNLTNSFYCLWCFVLYLFMISFIVVELLGMP